MNYLFLSFVLVCFIVFLVEIPDVIMTLQIYNSYVWVTKKKPALKQRMRIVLCMILITCVRYLTEHSYTLNRRSWPSYCKRSSSFQCPYDYI